MTISTSDIQSLRQKTGVGLMVAKRALEAAGGDLDRAMTELRKAGVKLAAKKSERVLKEGVIGTYLHSNGKVAAQVALACETDFVARNEDFKALAKELALHVAATNPRYVDRAAVPAEVVAEEQKIYRSQLKQAGQPPARWDKIVAGKLEKFYSEACLLEQPHVRDDTQTIQDLVTAAVAKLGENIQIVAFSRLAL